ncbi:hypothetical protein EXIGLDRAFT_834745 [Exidia glandulosa HHB12029]|uniref:MYND-type domain-containing protein n=1 Tax=Exidia glandulosa HHB12029 TaxID=1314781 RepID=A0A165JFP2_EXIGL|nr:hypothetical protein EXIGLDRAFT_834745 [Exidia glandulosa HHB12029]
MPSDYKKLERYARTFATQFRAFNPASPVLCLKCFYAFAAELDSAACEHLGAKCPEFYDALVHFVTIDHPLDYDGRIAISMRLLLCQGATTCTLCSALPVRSLPIRSDETPFNTLFDICCQLLSRGLIPYFDGNTSVMSTKIYRKPFRRGAWPSTPEQLLPHGPEETVGQLVRMSSVMHSGPVVLLAAMLQRYRKPVLEEILNPKHDNLLLRRVEGALEEASELASAALRAHNSRADLSSLSPTPASDTAVVKALERHIVFPQLLHVISFGVDFDSHDLGRFAFRYEARLYRTILSVLAHFHSPTAWVYGLPAVAMSLYSRLKAADRHDPPNFIREAALASKRRTEDVYALLADHLPVVIEKRACSGPGCGKQFHESANGKPFAKCGRCKALYYCSKECQRKDWSLKPGEPHKVICDILCEVLTIVSADTMFTTSSTDIARAWRDAALPEERARRLTVWMLGDKAERLPTAYAELLTDSIGQTPSPRTFEDCRTKEEMLQFIEKAAGCRYPPGSRIVMVPAEDVGKSSEPTEFLPLWSDHEDTGIAQVETADGRRFPGKFFLKVVPPGSPNL